MFANRRRTSADLVDKAMRRAEKEEEKMARSLQKQHKELAKALEKNERLIEASLGKATPQEQKLNAEIEKLERVIFHLEPES